MQVMRWIRRVVRLPLVLPATVAVVGILSCGEAKSADKALRIAISLTDIPNLWAAPDGGFEGVRFGGYPLFDALVMWDLTAADKPSRLVPGLAESWSVDPDNPKRWVFKLRQAKFHDGSPWNADALIWNLDSFKNSNARQYHPGRAGATATRTASIAAYGKIDDRT